MEKIPIEELKKQIVNNQNYARSLDINRETVDQEKFTVELSLSSEEPYERWFGWEILDHSEKSIRMERLKNGAAFRDTHYGDQIGIIEKVWIDAKEKKLRALIRFSKSTPRAIEIFKDITDGIRKNVSIRYMVHEMILEKEDDTSAYYRVTDWEPVHGSMEADPADFKVGVGRNLEPFQAQEIIDLIKESNKNFENKLKIISNKKDGVQMDPTKDNGTDITVAVKQAGENEKQRVRAINNLARDFENQMPAGFDLQKEADEYINSDKSVQDFQRLILSKQKEAHALQTPIGNADAEEKELVDYSIIRAIRAGLMIRGGASVDRLGKDYKLEIGLSKNIAEKTGRPAQGIYIPNQIMRRSQRDMLTSGQGAHFIASELRPDQLIEPLTNRLVTTRMGATYIDNCIGNLVLPKLTSQPTFGWRGTETTTITDSTPTTGTLTMTPKFGSAAVDISDALLIQSSVSVESLIKKHLDAVKALGIDLAALHGTGADGQPLGLSGHSIGSVDIAAMDWPAAVEFESDVDTGNALEGNLNYVTTPSVRGALKTRTKAGDFPVFLMSEDNKMNGYPVFSSNQIAANNIMFGDWEHLIIAEWGVTDLIVDPYTGARSGLIQLTLKVMIDIGVKYLAAFSKGTNFS